ITLQELSDKKEEKSMTRTEALCVLFEIGSVQATQEDVDLIKGRLDLTDEDFEQLPETVINQINAFQDDPELFLDALENESLKSFLRQLLEAPVEAEEQKKELPKLLVPVQELIQTSQWNVSRTAIEKAFKEANELQKRAWIARMNDYKKGCLGDNFILFGEYMLECIDLLQKGESQDSELYRCKFVSSP
ncbi:MAG: hypothetical protein AAB664_04400, partial [Patescibacteria group bacterium]